MTFEWWVAQHLVTTAILMAIVVVTCKLVPHRPALHHALWLVVLLKFLVPPGIVWPYSATQLTQHWVASEQAPPLDPPRIEAATQPASKAYVSIPSSPGSTLPGILARSEEPRENTPRALNNIQPKSESLELGHYSTSVSPPALSTIVPVTELAQVAPYWITTNQIRYVFTTIWILGGVIVAGHQFRRINHHRRLVASALPPPLALVEEIENLAQRMHVRTIPAVVSSETSTPFVWCLGRLKLIWPATMTDPGELRRWRGVLAHELAHVRRRDYATAWLELLASVIWWWNPLFWFTRRRLRESCELACDALAVEGLPDDRRTYAEVFLQLSIPLDGNSPVAALGVGSRDRRTFQRRLAMILSQRVTSRISWPGFLATAMLAALAIPSWTLGQNEATSEENAPPAATTESPEPATPAKTSDPANPKTNDVPSDNASDPQIRRTELEKQRAEIDKQLGALAEQRGNSLLRILGLKVEPIDMSKPEQHSLGRFRGGLEIKEVRPDSPGASAGLRAGDIMVGVGVYETCNLSNLEYALSRPETQNSAKVFLRRGNTNYTTEIEPFTALSVGAAPRMLSREADDIRSAQVPTPGQAPVAPSARATSPTTNLPSTAPVPLPQAGAYPPTYTQAPVATIRPIAARPDLVTEARENALSGVPADSIDVTNLGISIIEAEGEVELAENQMQYLMNAYKKAPGSIPESEVKAAGIKRQTAQKKQTLLIKIAQEAYDSARVDYELELLDFQRTELLGKERVISAEQLRKAKRQLVAAEARVKRLAAIPGIKPGE